MTFLSKFRPYNSAPTYPRLARIASVAKEQDMVEPLLGLDEYPFVVELALHTATDNQARYEAWLKERLAARPSSVAAACISTSW